MPAIEDVEYNRAMLDPDFTKSYRPTRGVETPVPPQGGSGLIAYEETTQSTENAPVPTGSQVEAAEINPSNYVPTRHE